MNHNQLVSALDPITGYDEHSADGALNGVREEAIVRLNWYRDILESILFQVDQYEGLAHVKVLSRKIRKELEAR